jgi:hypothetical protein
LVELLLMLTELLLLLRLGCSALLLAHLGEAWQASSHFAPPLEDLSELTHLGTVSDGRRSTTTGNDACPL